MFDEIRGSDYTIWLVALFLYVLDSAKLLSPTEMLLIETRRGRLEAGFSAHPFTLVGRVLSFAPLLQPHRGVFIAPWGRAWTDGTQLAATLDEMDLLRGSLHPVRLLASWAFVLLFVAGPLLTLTRGPTMAVVYVAALVYPTALAVSVIFWSQRREFRLTTLRWAGLSLELLLCPAFLPNLVRKVTVLLRVETDGAQVLLARASSEVWREFLERLEMQAQDLLDHDSDGPDDLRSYLATVKESQWPS